MISESISCPYCGKNIPFSEAISREIEAKLDEELHLRDEASPHHAVLARIEALKTELNELETALRREPPGGRRPPSA